MSELAVTALRLGLLAALWVLILAVVSSMGRDLMVGKTHKRRRNKQLEPALASEQAGGSPDSGAAPGASQRSAEPAAPRALARQLIVTEGPLNGKVIDLQGAPLLMGRAAEADLVLEDDYVSGRHARLFPQGTRWFLEDLGSTNGTYVNGAQLARTLAVEPGTPIRIGKTVLELQA